MLGAHGRIRFTPQSLTKPVCDISEGPSSRTVLANRAALPVNKVLAELAVLLVLVLG